MIDRVIDTRWSRVELVPMDAHCADISVALYHANDDDGDVGLVHTYSTKPGAAARIAFLAEAMRVLGGLESAGSDPALVRFACGTWHPLAARRLFLEAAKHDPAHPLAPRPLAVPDTRSEQTIRLEPLGSGRYAVRADGGTDEVPSRAPAIAAALAKLAELQGEENEIVVFPCGREHDALIALMLTRAQNLRAVLREEEMKASRGVLVAPSAQE
jgi:hypothetical protein